MWARENEWDDLFTTAADQEAARAGVTPAFLFALAKAHAGQESGFSPTAYHWDGPDPLLNVSRGLMQIEGATALGAGVPVGAETDTLTGPLAPRDYGETTVPGRINGLYDPNIAIPFAVHIIATNLAKSNGNVDEAIAAYNEGLGRAMADQAAGGAYHVQKYVDSVKAHLAYFVGLTVDPTDLPPAPTAPPTPSSFPMAAIVAAIITALLIAAAVLK